MESKSMDKVYLVYVLNFGVITGIIGMSAYIAVFGLPF